MPAEDGKRDEHSTSIALYAIGGSASFCSLGLFQNKDLHSDYSSNKKSGTTVLCQKKKNYFVHFYKQVHYILCKTQHLPVWITFLAYYNTFEAGKFVYTLLRHSFTGIRPTSSVQGGLNISFSLEMLQDSSSWDIQSHGLNNYWIFGLPIISRETAIIRLPACK